VHLIVHMLPARFAIKLPSATAIALSLSSTQLQHHSTTLQLLTIQYQYILLFILEPSLGIRPVPSIFTK